MQEYLTSSNLTLSDKKFLFKLRSKMLRIKGNFSSIYRGNLTCSLCLDDQSEENEMHLLSCPEIIKLLGGGVENVKHEDVFKGQAEQKRECLYSDRLWIFMRKKEKTNTPGASQHLQMPRMIFVLYDMDLNIYIACFILTVKKLLFSKDYAI